MADRDLLLGVLASAGGERSVFEDPGTAHLAAAGSRILSARRIPGLAVEAEETADGIRAAITVDGGVRVEKPVHLCFGMLHPGGFQRIVMRAEMGPRSSARLVAHCLFPRAEEVVHVMDGRIEVGEAADLRYQEVHFHGPHGGIEVRPRAAIRVAEDGIYQGDFALLRGRVGVLSIDYELEAGKAAVAELATRVFGHGEDDIRVSERIVLAGEGARGLIKVRIALEDRARAEVTGITEGNAPLARGHMDCMEIVRDEARAFASPVVRVTHPGAKITHEAAIGSVDRKQMETLMAHGLSPEEAVDVIVRGILR